MQLRLYVKANCRLCLQALEVLHRVRRDVPDLSLDVVDVASRPQLWRELANRVPVIEADGEELQAGRISEWQLRNWLSERGVSRAVE